MSQLAADIAPKVLAACGENAEEIAGAFGRAFDGEFVVSAGESEEHDPASLSGPGLAVLLTFGDSTLAAIVAADSGLTPDWAAEPDPTGQSKLSTLAQELSMLVVPDDLMAADSRCVWLADLPAAIAAGQPSTDAKAVPLELARGEQLGACRLIWPLANAGAIETAEPAGATANEAAVEETPADPPPSEASPEDAAPTARVLRWNGPPPRDYRDLPPNVVSALGVMVPVSVNLASKPAPVEEIVRLGPGSIITFDKSCEGYLEIAVADRPIAEGEAVKVGEKFGVRIKQMTLPAENFKPMLPPAG